MIFAMTNAVRERIKRDSKAGSKRSSSILTREEAKEDAFALLLQYADALSESPDYKLEDWLQTEEGLEQTLYEVRPGTHDSGSFLEPDLYFVHLRKDEGRNYLFFAHQATALTIGFQLGRHKLSAGRKSLLEIFYAGLRRLGYNADALETYFTNSPLSAFTTSGDPASRSWMNSIIREYYFHTPVEPVGKRLLERSNFVFNENRTYLWRQKHCWNRPPIDIFNEFFFDVTGCELVRSIPALRVQVRLLDKEHAGQAENADQAGLHIFDKNDYRNSREHLPFRSFLIPAICSFADLSQTMMACFGLLNYHWTKYVFRPELSSLAHETMILDSQDFEQSVAMERSFREGQPEEFMPALLDQGETGVGLLYELRGLKQYWQYDFGDNFWFEIEVVEEGILDGFRVEYLAGGGDAPPTDVGGYTGFAGFQDALKKPANGENADHIRWAVEVVYWQPYDANVIRDYLERVDPLAWDSRYAVSSFDSWVRSRDTARILEGLGVRGEQDTGDQGF
ncbi:MAG: hypothetical protein PHR78_06660 [Eubacteriales bacterium]|nr:hypothetical protein [Eubacteriales bacterium]